MFSIIALCLAIILHFNRNISMKRALYLRKHFINCARIKNIISVCAQICKRIYTDAILILLKLRFMEGARFIIDTIKAKYHSFFAVT